MLGGSTLVKLRPALFEAELAEESRIPATFEVLFLAGWAPHPDQSKPRPGPRPRIG